MRLRIDGITTGVLQPAHPRSKCNTSRAFLELVRLRTVRTALRIRRLLAGGSFCSALALHQRVNKKMSPVTRHICRKVIFDCWPISSFCLETTCSRSRSHLAPNMAVIFTAYISRNVSPRSPSENSFFEPTQRFRSPFRRLHDSYSRVVAGQDWLHLKLSMREWDFDVPYRKINRPDRIDGLLPLANAELVVTNAADDRMRNVLGIVRRLSRNPTRNISL